MKPIALLAISLFAMLLLSASPKPTSVYDFEVEDIIGNEVSLSRYKGKVLLIVNVASKCGLTNQYADLQELYDTYGEDGLVVLGFPANNFLNQEPGSNAEIDRFCTSKFGVTFPMFSKLSVKGANQHPLYQYLTKKEENGRLNAPVVWNFQKFLISRNGRVIRSFAPTQRVNSKTIQRAIQRQL